MLIISSANNEYYVNNKGSQWMHLPQAILYFYIEFKLCFLKHLKLE